MGDEVVSAVDTQPGEHYEVIIFPFVVSFKTKSIDYNSPPVSKQNEEYQLPLYPSPQYTFSKRRHVSMFIQALEDAHFTFRFSVPLADTPIWRSLDISLKAHLKENSFEMPLNRGDNGETYDNRSWELLHQSISRKDEKYTFRAVDVAVYDFTLDYLKKKAAASHPYKDKHQMLVIGKIYMTDR
jgi:hypothetical protein